MRIITLASRKGGCGKSTVAVHLACELQGRGHKVIVVDADDERCIETWEKESEASGLPTVVGKSLKLKGEIRQGYARLKKTLREIGTGHDVMIVDTPGVAGDTFKAMLLLADLAIIPCLPSAFDTSVLMRTLASVREAKRIKPSLATALLANGIDKREALSSELIQALDDCGQPAFQTNIRRATILAKAIAAGEGIATYKGGHPACLDFRKLADELEQALNLEVKNAA